MNLKIALIVLLLYLSFGSTSCKKEELTEEEKEWEQDLHEYDTGNQGLKDHFNNIDYFDMGVAIPASFVDNTAKTALIKRHYNSITAENDMKWSSLQPQEGSFNYTNADKIVSFAAANGIKIRGHCLCWHNQVPDWVFKDGTALATKEQILERLHTHITTVMTRYKGKVYAWDVVNEAIDDGSRTYRPSQWYSMCGEDYIIEAFRAAREADPDALLFYNDYSTIVPAKRDKIYDLAVKLKAENLIDGLGLQGHWSISFPSDDLIKQALDKFKSLGLQIQITEMDVSVYPSPSDPESEYTAEVEQQLTAAYDRFFTAFRSYSDVITSVTFWGLADDKTWLDNFPVAGRKNYPLLFDTGLRPKKAYFEITDF
ncbi:MAG: endo-1,4-beta-xylanase [Bacteroidales bacterium]|jgi:endo-1,4-beta-xylanase|nr:endo-1,4-beta-xylanase [Bacteroidales bacterium]